MTVMLSFTRVGDSFSTVLLAMLVCSPCGFRVDDAVVSHETVVGATGFEPATSRSQSGRSTKLSYAPA